MSTFKFEPRWKEELVCTGPGGTFVLELPMGVFTALIPTESIWLSMAPPWAHDLWPVLKEELEAWCAANKAEFVIEDTARVGWCICTSVPKPAKRRGRGKFTPNSAMAPGGVHESERDRISKFE